MTVQDLYVLLASHPGVVLLVAGVWPLLVGAASLALRMVGAKETSQQLANLGIAVGLVSVMLEGMGLAYGLTVHGVDPVAAVPVALLVAPPWLFLAGVATEHLIHPGRQEAFRRPVRMVLQLAAVALVLVAIFSVLRIHMLVFTGMLGFLFFVAVLIAVAWWMIRRMV